MEHWKRFLWVVCSQNKYLIFLLFLSGVNNLNNRPFATIGASASISMTYGARTISSASSIGNTNNSRHRPMHKNMIHVLSISASVTRIRWRPLANDRRNGIDRHASMIAVATAQVKGASAGGSGLISLWSYHRPFMPLSVVEGHEEGAVIDFDWLDTPQPTKFGMTAPMIKTLDADSIKTRVPGTSSHEVDSILYDSKEDQVGHIGIWQHLISVGKDGRCLVQSLVRGTSPHLTAQLIFSR